MALPKRPSPPSTSQKPNPLRRYAPLLVALVLCLLGGGAWWLGWLGRAEDPRVTELKQMQRDLAKQFSPTEGPKNFTDAAARVAAIGTVMTKMQSLPEELRPQAMAEGRSIMMQYMQARVDGYFALPPSKRDAYIDGEIRQMEFMRKAFEAGQTAMRFMGVGGARAGGQPAAGSTAAGPTAAAAPAAPPRPPGPMGRGMSRKEMIDRTTPQQRAQFQEYFSQVEQRRKALGLPPGGGPPR
jgi:hypothetical protein